MTYAHSDNYRRSKTYFVYDGEMIKIGRAVNLRKRLAQEATGTWHNRLGPDVRRQFGGKAGPK